MRKGGRTRNTDSIPGDNNLFETCMATHDLLYLPRLVKVEDEVQLTDIAEVPVEALYEMMDLDWHAHGRWQRSRKTSTRTKWW